MRFRDKPFTHYTERIGADHYWPNVGCQPHKHRLPNMFDKWYNIPKAAHRLYWRLHPQEQFWTTKHN